MARSNLKKAAKQVASPQISLTAPGEVALALLPHFAFDPGGQWDSKELAHWITNKVDDNSVTRAAFLGAPIEARRVFWFRDRWMVSRPFGVPNAAVAASATSGVDSITAAGPRPPGLDQVSHPVIRRVNVEEKGSPTLEQADPRSLAYLFRWIWVARVSDQIAPRAGDPAWDLFAGPSSNQNYDDRGLFVAPARSALQQSGVKLASVAELSKELGVVLPASYY